MLSVVETVINEQKLAGSSISHLVKSPGEVMGPAMKQGYADVKQSRPKGVTSANVKDIPSGKSKKQHGSKMSGVTNKPLS